MKIEYIRNLNGSYMIIRDVDYPCRSYELMMLLNNRIPGLLSLQIIVGDGKLEYWYDITGMTSLDTQLMLISLDASGLQTMTEDIFDMNLGLEEYLLDGKNICGKIQILLSARKRRSRTPRYAESDGIPADEN